MLKSDLEARCARVLELEKRLLQSEQESNDGDARLKQLLDEFEKRKAFISSELDVREKAEALDAFEARLQHLSKEQADSERSLAAQRENLVAEREALSRECAATEIEKSQVSKSRAMLDLEFAKLQGRQC
uniref:Uncharacterized protein LOC113795383 n=1 Tax=Dermatophagoides pteronyssinus TaxID=6956 RepID=A0A6P6Y7J7_DERPT|nr:uncharacterized protein LOC113795383 [Dermatophagoides pteronyssinus]